MRQNLHQMAIGCLALESNHRHLPGGGWGWMWAGEPDRGFGAEQPGGWHFNILPYIDRVDLYDLGKAVAPNTRLAQGQMQAQTPVAIFICPTRRKVQVYFRETASSAPYINITDPSPIIGRSDYAANAGSNYSDTSDGGANPNYDPKYDWSSEAGTTNSKVEIATGVIYRASELPLAWIKDGQSNTYLIGERYLCINAYYSGDYCDDDQGWDSGYNYDTQRGTGFGYVDLAGLPAAIPNPPSQDRLGLCGCMTNFGSAHPAGFNMAFCDGVVRMINYDINPTLHMQLGHRADGEPTQLQGLDAK